MGVGMKCEQMSSQRRAEPFEQSELYHVRMCYRRQHMKWVRVLTEGSYVRASRRDLSHRTNKQLTASYFEGPKIECSKTIMASEGCSGAECEHAKICK
jgi:hypothetical protein